MTVDDLLLDIEQHVEVKGPIADVFRGVLHRFGPGNTRPDGQSLNLSIEPHAGGRWLRDMGNGTSYLWGHVQVIKPPVLLELSGPMFMSYPATNHIAIRLEEAGGVTRVSLRHRAIGLIEKPHRDNIGTGWRHNLDLIVKDFA